MGNKHGKMFSKRSEMFSMQDVMFDQRGQRKKKKALKYAGIALLLLLIILIIAVLIFTNMGSAPIVSKEENKEIDTKFELVSIVEADNPFFDAFTDRQKVNILLAGINTGLTDTIMLASFDIDAEKVDVISIPRDTYYPREGFDGPAAKKINAAYRSDINNTAEAVSDLLMGIPIHYYAVIQFEGIEKVVDAMGGVPINVPFHMHYEDPRDTPPLVIDIPEGYQVLSGEMAVKYLRFRKASGGYESYPMSDLDRAKAQEEFLQAAFAQSMGPDFIPVVKSVYDNVESNVDWKTASKIALKAKSMGSSDIYTYTLPGKAQVEAPYYYMPDEEKIEELIRQIYALPPEKTSDGAIANEDD